MKIFKAILIDDEVDTIDILTLLLTKSCPGIEVVATATNIENAVIEINNHNPDVIFLDIEMPGGNGFDLLQALPEKKFQTIFVTGHEHYAIKAIKYSALDYILKPIDEQELIEAVDKINQIYNQSKDQRMDYFGELMSQDDTSYDKLIIPSSKGFKHLYVKDILYLESHSGNYCMIYMADGSMEMATRALTYYESLLPDQYFIRINRSNLINLEAVKSFESQSRKLELYQSDVQLIVSTRKISIFRKMLKNQSLNE